MLPTSYEEIGNWGLPVVEDEPVTAFKQCMSIHWGIKSLQVPPTTMITRFTATPNNIKITTSKNLEAISWSWRRRSCSTTTSPARSEELPENIWGNRPMVLQETSPEPNCWGKNHLRVIDLVLLVLLIRLSLDTAEDWACRAGDPWLPCRGSRVWWTELWLHLFTKHLHDGGYVGQSWPTAKSLKHKSVLTILTALTLLHKSYLGHRGNSRNGLYFKRNFQGKSESEMKSWPVTPKELCALPGPSWKAGQVLLSHFAVIGFIIIFLM